ncbi:PLDc_N domain-containing protein [Seongchinamella unica]|uniref:PLDc_N domain-containing protein n=1 Tax=Seongchinamella unica TaxID=2547392 RepID=A0A4V2ZX50_9GAMM|nr:PLDc_N domain-containing protein [Seongchinamella unica]
MGIEVSGVVGLLVLVLDIWAIINILGSASSAGSKLVWTLVILLLPVIGVIIWFFLGPRSRAA